MKELIKPASSKIENELYDALCEKTCNCHDICLCKSKAILADEDETDIIF